ncbi:PREDICTED: phosphoribosylaminoimidazole-succinocarboxamide synthase, chloroplastic [Tarenaya hassleriana]|uniref:phosphoribosylaminoimidazole-succinocarboxamide synthase, chloroplastic n=1 Tax=Tarenaya hassleriana TaxID=28532 RepID=UPI00053C7752|nr:PREDICTED: phosphoribosylaminoimidazole-succinocarboxamide synthase, chloroplastic [Tarenaya hassleriana]XP_010544173.1 PREDICTED: phosphoribosylaminoimidazole-succinocarboxamide synthase, chloroplastic [Tarenaya hassleriana]XP_010544174.1 PREDICTED: phosphoribosylaminoimidazole-succinocarboxamide synthase, chloroplastic [Tarenaya hassleriana]
MAQCVRSTLNPARTPHCVSENPAKKPSFASVSFLKAKPKFTKYARLCSSVMSSQCNAQNQQDQGQQLSLDDLITSTRKGEVLDTIKDSLSNCLSDTDLLSTVPALRSKIKGKVRDIYDAGDYLVLVTTDRQSAFDRVLASIPFKGQVLNETSLWWFNNTQHITPNAIVSSPDKNVVIAKKCSVFPVEFVVRGYVTGSTDTSLWTVYKNGVRNYCGNELPDGLVKNQKLSANILTPTTKAEDHDVPISPNEIVEQGLMTQAEFDEASRKALSLFEFGQRVAREHGLILVDTKYEFGKNSDGSILLIDEIHTPDSSRYWLAGSYEERFEKGLEPENVDKEFLRLWFRENCNPYEDKVLPDAPADLVTELAWRYIFLYETITGSRIDIAPAQEPVHDRMSRNVRLAISSLG